MQIRSETPADYAAIATLHMRAFGDQATEAVIVALLRHRASFDPALALVAEQEGQIVGHAHFTPVMIRLSGQKLRAVLLAPIGVLPAWQGRGIGAALIEAGHALAQAQGFEMAFLLGHSDYYPRFGYQIGAFGESTTVVGVDNLPQEALLSRETLVDDIPALMALWHMQEASVDFALEPEATPMDWLTPAPGTRHQALTFLRDGQIIGYARGRGRYVRVFLAADEDAALRMAGWLAGRAHKIVLPLHPASAITACFTAEVSVNRWDAGMALPFTPQASDLFNQYMSEVDEGQRPVGRPIWPTAFDLA